MKNWFNLSDDEILDLEIETHDFVGKYLEENIINLHNPHFYDEMVGVCAPPMWSKTEIHSLFSKVFTNRYEFM